MQSRKNIILSFLLLLSLVLAACGDDSTATQAPAAANTIAAGAAGTSTTAAASSGVELNMWTWKIAHVAGLQVVAANYQAKTGTKVNIQAFNPDDTYRTKITTSAQSGDLPDILSYWSGSTTAGGEWDMGAAGLLTELTGKVDSTWQSQFLSGTYTKSSVLTQDVVDTCAKDPKCNFKNLKVGQSFSVPYLAGNAFFVYANKSMMTKAGLDPNTPPKTAEEWLTMMQTIKQKTGTPGVVTGVKNADVLQFWLYNPLLMASCGQDTFDSIYNGRDSFANPCSMNVLNWINSISTNDLWAADILNTDIDPADVAFTQGKAAFDIGGTYTLSFLLAQGMKTDDVLSFAIPPLKGSKYDKLAINASPLIDAMITKNSKHQDQALDFLKFLTSPDQMAAFAKVVGDLPAVKISSDPAKVGAVMSGLVSSISDNSPFATSKAQQLTDPSKVLKLGLQQFITKEEKPDALAKKVDDANKAAWDARGGPPKA
jgi:ABC-type glycerol-3-phosphate transport system substrate-binding protein